jgi:succinate dehydrogenase hydrophobic anchor subunit
MRLGGVSAEALDLHLVLFNSRQQIAERIGALVLYFCPGFVISLYAFAQRESMGNVSGDDLVRRLLHPVLQFHFWLAVVCAAVTLALGLLAFWNGQRIRTAMVEGLLLDDVESKEAR